MSLHEESKCPKCKTGTLYNILIGYKKEVEKSEMVCNNPKCYARFSINT